MQQQNPRGSMILPMIAVLIIINLVVVAVVISGGRDHDLTVKRVETAQAYYAAESGLNMAMREVFTDADDDGDCKVGSVSYDGLTNNNPTIGGGEFMVTGSVNGNNVALYSYGQSGGTRRQISMTFQLAQHQITFDNASSTTGEIGSLTFNHTIGSGSNRLLVVCMSSESSGVGATSATYNGVAMTQSAAVHTVGSSTFNHAEIWYMLDADLPPAGTYQVQVTTGGSDGDQAGAISVFGAAQQAPEATAVDDDGDSGASSISTAITTLTDNAWVFEAVMSGNAVANWQVDDGQDERYDEVASSSRGAGCTKEISSAGTVNLGWSCSGSNRIVHVLAAFAPN